MYECVLPQLGQLSVDDWFRPGIPSRWWKGGIAEIIAYDRVLSEVERQQVEAYLANKWGTPLPPPIPTTSLQLWLDADDASTFSYSSGALVSQWRDKSGRGTHLAQGTEYRQPSRSGTRNGRTTVMFDGSRAVTATPTTPISSVTFQWTFFIVVIKTGEPMTFEVCSTCVTHTHLGGGPPTTQTDAGASFYSAPGSPPDYRTAFPDLSIYRVRVDRGTPAPVMEVKGEEVINGLVKFATVAGNSTTWNTTNQQIFVGARGDYATFLRGEIGEVIVYDRYLSTAEVTSVEAYLYQKWMAPPAPSIPTTGLQLWLDADDWSTFSYSSGVVVSQWRDKSGGNHHANHLYSQPETTRPTRDVTINGRTAIKVEPGQPGLNHTYPALRIQPFASAYTAGEMFMVLQVTNDTSGAYHYKWGTDTLWNHYTAGNVIYDNWGSTVRHAIGNPVPELTDPHIYNLRSGPGLYEGAINGTTLYTNLSNTVAFGSAPYEIPMGGNEGVGKIGEYIVYNRVLSTVERQQVESYLKAKWGTP